VFISHADRDHLAGLLQYNQLSSFRKPTIYYPKDANSLHFLAEFTAKFDPHTVNTLWKPLADNEIIPIKTGFSVQGFENKHIDVSGKLKSLSYKVVETKNKLKPEFYGLKAEELIVLKKEKGEDFIKESEHKNILIYSADTPVFDYSKFDNCQVLIHEATFLSKKELDKGNQKNKHSSLEEVMQMVSEIKVEKLILGHFSSRYEQEKADHEIKHFIKQYDIKIPVYRIPIGICAKDILSGNPIN